MAFRFLLLLGFMSSDFSEDGNRSEAMLRAKMGACPPISLQKQTGNIITLH
jgi:hypothetical protein